MKKSILSLLALLVFAAMTVQARTFVLSVGVGESNIADHCYFGSEGAAAFRDLMQQHSKDVTLMTSSNVTKSNFIGKLKEIAGAATDQDRIYVYIACHGGPGCLALYDDFVTYDEIVEVLNKSSSPMCVCFLDSCHSGSSAVSVGNALAAKGKNNVAFMTGCRPDEYSWNNSIIGSGFFTKALLKGLRGKSDANGDKRITMKELFKYVYNDVVHRNANTKGIDKPQHPQLIAPANIQDAAVLVWQ